MGESPFGNLSQVFIQELLRGLEVDEILVEADPGSSLPPEEEAEDSLGTAQVEVYVRGRDPQMTGEQPDLRGVSVSGILDHCVGCCV